MGSLVLIPSSASRTRQWQEFVAQISSPVTHVSSLVAACKRAGALLVAL